jgi:hypothetical protein
MITMAGRLGFGCLGRFGMAASIEHMLAREFEGVDVLPGNMP